MDMLKKIIVLIFIGSALASMATDTVLYQNKTNYTSTNKVYFTNLENEYVGDGSGVTNINGTNIFDNTVDSNKFTIATRQGLIVKVAETLIFLQKLELLQTTMAHSIYLV